MRMVYEPKGKMSSYFFHKVYENIEIKDQEQHIFFSDGVHVTGGTVQIQGYATFYYSKYATSPKVEMNKVKVFKGPVEENVSIAEIIEDVEVGADVKLYGSDFPFKAVSIEVEQDFHEKNIMVAGMDNFAVEDVVIELDDRVLTPNVEIKQGTNYIVGDFDSSEHGQPLLTKVERPEIKVEIYRGSLDEEYGELIFDNVNYSFEEPLFWEGNINFLILDNPPLKNETYKYTVLTKCNNANIDAPIEMKYAAVTISQIG